MGWKGVERWRGKTPHGTERHVTLARLEALGPMPGGAWRVEWWQTGSTHQGESFAADQEEQARTLCAAKRAEVNADWENLSEIDIRSPKPASDLGRAP